MTLRKRMMSRLTPLLAGTTGRGAALRVVGGALGAWGVTKGALFPPSRPERRVEMGLMAGVADGARAPCVGGVLCPLLAAFGREARELESEWGGAGGPSSSTDGTEARDATPCGRLA